ncbi:MAG: hypothetical protein RL259_585 [Bacteroidota bacterium]|jgi:hypothetical protein
MPAPKGHQLWGNPLNPKKYTPEELWQKSCEYFCWCNENPIYKNEAIKGGDMAGTIIDIPMQRPLSIEGLCIYLNISDETFKNYEKKEGYETFFGVCSHIRKIIDTQHFEGGMVGIFNANIVTRKLGLAEKSELYSPDGTMTPKTTIIWGGNEFSL